MRLTLRCTDPSRDSVQWDCDASSCVPRVFRLNPNVQRPDEWTSANVKKVLGPYLNDWQHWTGKRAGDLDRLLCARPARVDAGATRRYRKGYLDCATWTPFSRETVAVGELARDLARELDMVLEFGCAGACSPALERAQQLARRFLEPGPLRLLSARGQFDPGDDEDPLWPESIGWVARLTRGDAEVEIACARHQTIDSVGEPPSNQCRLNVLERHRPLAQYYPTWYQNVELPDRGALHLQGSVDGPHLDLGNDIVILGSALATAPPPDGPTIKSGD